jgi:hypothetical protein
MQEVSITDDVPTRNAELVRLERRIAELEADISLINGVIGHLERIVPGERLLSTPSTRHGRWNDIAHEVEGKPFADT